MRRLPALITRPIRALLVVVSSGLLVACATVPDAPPPPSLFADHLFAAATGPVDEAIFEPSDAMRRLVEDKLRSTGSRQARQRLLVDLFQPQGPIRLRYDTQFTRTAAQAYESGSANCLSLTVLAASLARLMEVPVRFNEVFVDTSWARTDGLLLASGHVNVTVGGGHDDPTVHRPEAPATVIDFLPADELRGQRSRTISEDEIVAMFMNNRAAELLEAMRLDEAYAWARRAVERRPSSVSSINTLAVIYLRRGALSEAVTALAHAHRIAPRNTHVLSNLVQALERSGSTAEADRYRELLATAEAVPPLHFFDLGVAAMNSGDYGAALKHFQRELDQGIDYHEVRFALGLAQAALGDFRAAQRTLAVAVETSAPGRTRELYKAKLALIDERAAR